MRATPAILVFGLSFVSAHFSPPASQPASRPAGEASPAERPPEGASPAARPPEATSPAGRPLYYERDITGADLEGRTLRELHLMRNWIYARAGNSFRKEWLAEFFNARPWYRPLPRYDESRITALDRSNARVIVAYEAGLGEEELSRRLEEIRDREGTSAFTKEDVIELHLLRSRLQRPLDDAGVPEERAGAGIMEDPRLLERQITIKQLDDLSRRDLRILRNLIYARRGRPFGPGVLRSYFGTLGWYRPDSSYTDARLTDIDLRNIKLIRSLEDELGGPVKDEEWFGGA